MIARSRKFLATTVVAVVTAAYVVAPIAPATAGHCSGDTWADVPNGASNGTIHWQDNYVVGTGCDLNGEYTLGIQRINWGLGFRNSTRDGFYGSNTKQDIKDFQSSVGETADGIVGVNTWDAYETKMVYDGSAGTWKYYKSVGHSRAWFRHTGLSPDRWYGLKKNASSTWVQFGTSGPA